jgi:hypothetical protein
VFNLCEDVLLNANIHSSSSLTFAEMRSQLEMEGFIFVKHVFNKETVDTARSAILQAAANDGSIITDRASLEERRIKKSEASYCVDNTGHEIYDRATFDEKAWKELMECDEIHSLMNGPQIHEFLSKLFDGSRTTIIHDEGYIRLVGNDDASPEHAVCYSFSLRCLAPFFTGCFPQFVSFFFWYA